MTRARKRTTGTGCAARAGPGVVMVNQFVEVKAKGTPRVRQVRCRPSREIRRNAALGRSPRGGPLSGDDHNVATNTLADIFVSNRLWLLAGLDGQPRQAIYICVSMVELSDCFVPLWSPP